MFANGAFKNPFADMDFSKMAGEFKFPMINMETVVETSRKNFTIMNSDAKTLQLWGAIAVFTDDGNEMHTDVAYVDLVKGIVIGPHHVTGQGPQGTYVADRFRIERLSDPCNKSKKAPAHASKPKHPGHEPQVICPTPITGAVTPKSKPLIFLNGNVHMVLYHQSKKK